MLISETEGEHGELEIVHLKTFIPNPNPVMFVVGESEFVMMPVPEINDQVPTPTVALLAAITVVGVEIQMVWLGPAFAIEGAGLTVILISETEGEHGELVISHLKTFIPNPNPVMFVVGESEFVMIPVPEINDQVPTPTVAVLAVITVVGVEIQMV